MTSEYEHLQQATDAGLMQGRFEKEIGRIWKRPVSFEEFWVTRVFPRNNGGFAVQYSVVVEGDDRQPWRRLFFCGSLLGPSGSWPVYALKDDGRSFVLEDLRLAVPVFPFDPKLPSLPELYGLKTISSIVRCFKDNMRLDSEKMKVIGCELLGYRLERRCVLRYVLRHKDGRDCGGDEFRMVAKIMRPGRSTGALQALNRLERNGFHAGAKDRIVVPLVYCSDDKMGAIFMENAPGTTLHSLIGKPTFVKVCGEAGRLLRKLHALKTEGLQHYTAMDELENFGRRFETVIGLFPRLTGIFEQILERLNRDRASIETGFAFVCTHRDFYDKQVLYTSTRTTLLDCDNLAAADPALDFGNFMAHIVLRRIQVPEHARDIEMGMKVFAESYAGADPEFEIRGRWWLAVSLMRLAALYSLRPRWRMLGPKLLEEAARYSDREEIKYGGANAIDAN
jgi:hypothetical protein